MVAPLLRGIASTLTLLVAIVVTDRWGDTAGKVVAGLIGAILIALIEWFVQWSPKHMDWARSLLDPRAIWTGIWVQEVRTVTDAKGRHPDDSNSCSVFRVDYTTGDGYWVQGDAYSRTGTLVAYYSSTEVPAFTKDGRTMSYVWQGDVIVADAGPASAEREGLSRMTLDQGERNSGVGRVQHVGMDRELVVTLTRVTNDYLRQQALDAFTLESLRSRGERRQFAEQLSRKLGSTSGAGSSGAGGTG